MAEENQNTLDTSKYNSFIVEDKPTENILVPDIVDKGSKYNKFIVQDKTETLPLQTVLRDFNWPYMMCTNRLVGFIWTPIQNQDLTRKLAKEG